MVFSDYTDVSPLHKDHGLLEDREVRRKRLNRRLYEQSVAGISQIDCPASTVKDPRKKKEDTGSTKDDRSRDREASTQKAAT